MEGCRGATGIVQGLNYTMHKNVFDQQVSYKIYYPSKLEVCSCNFTFSMHQQLMLT